MSDDSTETRRLLAQVHQRPREVFDELFDRHRNQLREAVELRLDPSLRRRIDASDVVQETSLEAYGRLSEFLQRRPMPFGIWLRKTTLQQVQRHQRMHLKAARRSVHREQSYSDRSSMMIAAPFLTPSPSEQIARQEYKRTVIEAVNELGRLDREMLLMRNVEQLSHLDISRILEMSHDAVRKRYGRALMKLQQLLVQKGVVDKQR